MYHDSVSGKVSSTQSVPKGPKHKISPAGLDRRMSVPSEIGAKGQPATENGGQHGTGASRGPSTRPPPSPSTGSNPKVEVVVLSDDDNDAGPLVLD